MASLYKNGMWVWDQFNNGIMFQTKDALLKNPSRVSKVSNISVSISGRKNIDAEIRIMDTVDTYTQARFRKHYQRKVKVTDVAVVTIQDVKDVAIFTCQKEDLTPEFISYFHTAAMDRYLRSMIVYFQYYFQVWGKMQLRRKEASRKLRQPIVTELENEVRDNLADLRSMVSRDYAAILLGLEDAKKFHHMHNKNNDSLSDKDRRLFETLSFLTVKVVWVALFRKHLPLIEKELNRLLRTFYFSPLEHSGKPTPLATPEEQRILLGKAFNEERKLLHRSPCIQEIIFDDHDYRMMAIGIKNIPGADVRIRYLEIAFAASEELLVPSGISVGVLGVERKYLDAMLKPKEISTTVKRTSVMKIGDFTLPPKVNDSSWVYSETLPKEPCRFQESEATKQARKSQCKKWRTYLEMGGAIISDLMEIDSGPTLRTSIAPSSTY